MTEKEILRYAIRGIMAEISEWWEKRNAVLSLDPDVLSPQELLEMISGINSTINELKQRLEWLKNRERSL